MESFKLVEEIDVALQKMKELDDDVSNCNKLLR